MFMLKFTWRGPHFPPCRTSYSVSACGRVAIASAGVEMARPMFAMICANNVNRSTEAHDHLHAAGLRVCSFGAGNKVRFPGPSRYDPRIFEFYTPYETMYQQLKAENSELFRRNGVLAMLERDILTKKAPQKWQDLGEKDLHGLDVVLCFDDRIFEIVLEDLQLRPCASGDWRPLHLLCLDTKDTPEHAKIGGSLALELCQAIDKLPDLNEGDALVRVIQAFEERHKLHLVYSLLHI